MDGMRLVAVALLTLAGSVLLAGACSSSDAGSQTIPSDAQRLTVLVGDSLSFDPPALTIQSGRPVAITIRSTGNTDHDFTITGMPATGRQSDFKAGHGHIRAAAGAVVGHPKTGGAATVQFNATTPGVYEFYCSIAGHRDAGMTGTITVT